MDGIVKHPEFGIGEILEINVDKESPIIVSVLWSNGNISNCTADELEFLPI
jgi:hypothetical protein